MVKKPIRDKQPIIWGYSNRSYRETGMEAPASPMWWAFCIKNMENKKTIKYLNGKVWYRFIKVLFILIFFSVLVGYNIDISYYGIKKIDLQNSVVKCNFGPDYKKSNLSDLGLYLSASDFYNYNYKSFYTNPDNEYSIKTILSFCTGTPYSQINPLVQQGAFDYRKNIPFDGGVSANDFIKAVTYEHHLFDITPVFSYSNFFENFFIYNIIIIFVFEVIRRGFYYVVLGTLKPENS